ncbi:MAG: hypothetical protein Q9213_007380 [Squamulea squamosa]
MDLPDEIVLMILEYLPKTSLKSSRLVCKDIAALGALILIDKVYLSPYSKDMEVFHAISQHPTFCGSVKHLVYDSVQFERGMSIQGYHEGLCRQFATKNYNGDIISDNAVYELKHIINEAPAASSSDSQDTRSSYQRCQQHTGFLRGFQEYSQCAEEYEIHGFGDSGGLWFAEALESLKRLQGIYTVTIRNTWDMILDVADLTDDLIEDQHYSWSVDENNIGYRKWGVAMQIPPTYQLSDNLRVNGMRMIGSPLARAWPPAHLQPGSTVFYEDDTSPYHVLDISDGGFEFFQVSKLLRSAGMTCRIQQFRVLGDPECRGGISPNVLDPVQWPSSTRFLDFSMTLRALQLNLIPIYSDADMISQPYFDLDVLKSFIQEAHPLEHLSLVLPFHDKFEYSSADPSSTPSSSEHEAFYHFTRLFPPVTQWRLPHLRSLELRGLSASYRDLATLLHLNLPKLDLLALSYINLTDGSWEDIIEGFRRPPGIRWCEFKGALLESMEPLWKRIQRDTGRGKNEAELLGHLEFYILEGGRHPCLPKDEPDTLVSGEKSNFQFILRLLNTNVEGKQKIMYALTKIKGVGRRYSNLVCKKADVDLNKRAGEITSEELERIVTIIQNPTQYKIPTWFLNRQRDIVDGKDTQVLANGMDSKLREDLERLKKIRAHRGLRHYWGLRVRGQHSKTTGRRGRTVGVSKKKG